MEGPEGLTAQVPGDQVPHPGIVDQPLGLHPPEAGLSGKVLVVQFDGLGVPDAPAQAGEHLEVHGLDRRGFVADPVGHPTIVPGDRRPKGFEQVGGDQGTVGLARGPSLDQGGKQHPAFVGELELGEGFVVPVPMPAAVVHDRGVQAPTQVFNVPLHLPGTHLKVSGRFFGGYPAPLAQAAVEVGHPFHLTHRFLLGAAAEPARRAPDSG
jgi:hypothetical protein